MIPRIMSYSDLFDLFAAMRSKAHDEGYPPELLDARRESVKRQIGELLDCADIATEPVSNPLDARRWEIVAALQDEFIDKATAFELLEELAEIITRQE